MQNDLNKITNCEICGNSDLHEVLDLGLHPMCDDLVEVGSDRVCREYPIVILYCEKCSSGHQKFQVPKKDLFPSTYHYRSRFTVDVLEGMAALVESCETRFGSLEGKKVLDVGCNDGSLLGYFEKKGASTFGIEPTGAYVEAVEKGHTVLNEFLTSSLAEKFVEEHGKPDFITFTNVFAHIEDLGDLTAAVRNLMKPTTVVIIENHYLGAVLSGNQFDTFYHEHPRTYSFNSFVNIAKNMKTELLDAEFSKRYGGNIRVYMSDSKHGITPSQSFSEIIEKEMKFPDGFKTMGQNINKWKETKLQLIDELTKKFGKLRAKAFPGRAAILAKLLELDESKIKICYEKPGSLKVGHYIPGTRIPIASDDDLFKDPDKDSPIVSLAWHIPTEITGYLKKNGQLGEIYNILQASDFE